MAENEAELRHVVFEVPRGLVQELKDVVGGLAACQGVEIAIISDTAKPRFNPDFIAMADDPESNEPVPVVTTRLLKDFAENMFGSNMHGVRTANILINRGKSHPNIVPFLLFPAKANEPALGIRADKLGALNGLLANHRARPMGLTAKGLLMLQKYEDELLINNPRVKTKKTS